MKSHVPADWDKFDAVKESQFEAVLKAQLGSFKKLSHPPQQVAAIKPRQPEDRPALTSSPSQTGLRSPSSNSSTPTSSSKSTYKPKKDKGTGTGKLAKSFSQKATDALLGKKASSKLDVQPYR